MSSRKVAMGACRRGREGKGEREEAGGAAWGAMGAAPLCSVPAVC
jgi:hypothetical protein